MLSPVELEIELFCRGLRLEENCDRRAGRTADLTDPRRPRLGAGARHSDGPQADLGQRAGRRGLRLDVPFRARPDRNRLLRRRRPDAATSYPVLIPEEPAWYGRATSSGIPMSRIGVLQGNYLGVYVSNACLYWARNEACQVLHDRKERRCQRAGTQEGRGRRRGGASPRATSRARSSRTSTPGTTSRKSTGSSRSTACASASRTCGPSGRKSADSSASRPTPSRATSSRSTTP